MSDERTSSAFSDAELAAMKQRAAELRAEGAGGTGTAKKKREAQACAEALAALEGTDHAIGNRLHEIVQEEAPHLDPKTWYGFPSYARDGKVVVFFKDAGKFKSRYATLGFEEAANLDDGPMWPTSYALTEWTPAVEQKVAALVKAATS